MAKKPGKKVGIDRREAFIRHYLIHQNASRAYREAGYKDGPGTRQSAHRLLTSAYIQARISEERQKLIAALDVTLETIARRFRDIAFCDIAGITEYLAGPCRYCHGIDHAYQWRSPAEYKAAQPAAAAKADHDAGPEGGYGYNSALFPNPDCPECDGEGVARVSFKDTRLLTDSERAAFAGVEETAHGIRYRFHNRFAALQALAKRLGFYAPRRKEEPQALAERLIEDMWTRHLERQTP